MRTILAALFFLILLTVPAVASDQHDRLFDTLDRNGDGSLSKQEFRESTMHPIDREKVIQLFPGFKDSASLNDAEMRDRLFDAMDSNKDGLLSRDEFKKVAPNVLIIRF